MIVNGGAKAVADEESRVSFAAAVRAALPESSLVFTEPGTDVAELARQAVASGRTMVVAAGGDGTVNAVAGALAGTEVVLGVLPLGTLNHFAVDLGIPVSVVDAIAVLGARHVTPVDVGEVNGRVFVNNSGIGLYPDIVRQRELRQRAGASKWPAAVSAAVRELVRYRLHRIRIVIDGRTMLRDTPVVFVGNNEYVADGPLEPRRRRLDGAQLYVYIAHPTGRLRLVWFAIRALLPGRTRPETQFDVLKTGTFHIESRHRELRVSFDGEVALMTTPLEYRTRPGSLHVAVKRQNP